MKEELQALYNLLNEMEIKGIHNIAVSFKMAAILEKMINDEIEQEKQPPVKEE
jgi:hypothetical protein